MINCNLCGGNDTSKILDNRPDYEYSIMTRLDYYKCNNKMCGFVFVKSEPSNEQIQSFYSKYSTHTFNKKISNLNLLAKISQYFKDRSLRELFFNTNYNQAKVLDFGCGNGNLLYDLKKLGIKNLFGYDFDTKAIETSKNDGIVFFSDYNQISNNGKYDYIFLNHVVEHLYDARSVIQNLSKHLNDSGKIIIRTPNTDSFLCNLFDENWRGWETPRHLGIYNYRNIDLLKQSLHIDRKWTSNIMFSGIFHESIRSQFFSNTFIGKVSKHLMSYLFYTYAFVLNLIFRNRGEEVCIIFTMN